LVLGQEGPKTYVQIFSFRDSFAPFVFLFFPLHVRDGMLTWRVVAARTLPNLEELIMTGIESWDLGEEEDNEEETKAARNIDSNGGEDFGRPDELESASDDSWEKINQDHPKEETENGNEKSKIHSSSRASNTSGDEGGGLRGSDEFENSGDFHPRLFDVSFRLAI
jgi:hypothetical protein